MGWASSTSPSDPLSMTVVYSHSSGTLSIAMVDFIHCSGPIYGILVVTSSNYVVRFLPLTSSATGGAAIDVAGNGTQGNVDGIGSAALFGNCGYVAAAHTAPVWLIAGLSTESIRRAVFTSDVPLRLNVTTLITTPGKQPNGVVANSDDSILYVGANNSAQIIAVLNPLSSTPTLGPVLSIVANGMHKISLHPGCESLLLVGCQGEYLLVYNITSQSTIQSIRALESYYAGAHYTLAGTVIANGTVIFAGYSASLGLDSWCCLPSYAASILPAYAPSASPVLLPASFIMTRDFIHDTRSEGLFSSHSTTGIQYLSLNPVTSTVVYSFTLYLGLAIVDFIHCSGPLYGILITHQIGYKMSFLPLTPATAGTPPIGGTAIDIAGDGTNGNVDGVGSEARFSSLGFTAAAHTAPVWMVGSMGSQNIRRAVFTNERSALPQRDDSHFDFWEKSKRGARSKRGGVVTTRYDALRRVTAP